MKKQPCSEQNQEFANITLAEILRLSFKLTQELIITFLTSGFHPTL